MNRDRATGPREVHLEARDHLSRVHAGFHQFQGDPPARRFGLIRQPDFAHAAFPDQTLQLVPVDHRTHVFARLLKRRMQIGRDEPGRVLNGRPIKKLSAGSGEVGFEEPQHLSAHD